MSNLTVGCEDSWQRQGICHGGRHTVEPLALLVTTMTNDVGWAGCYYASVTADSTNSAKMSASTRSGYIFGIVAYFIWGSFPLYFRVMDQASPLEIMAHRILWSLVVCVGLLAIFRQPWPKRVFATPRVAGLAAAAAALIAVNWFVYVYGINTGRVVESSLGYFITPLVSIALGVVVLRERLNWRQRLSVVLGAVAVVVLTAVAGYLPWIAVTLAVSFAIYGLVKKQLGQHVTAVQGLTVETLFLAPIAAASLWWVESQGQLAFGSSLSLSALLASTGIVTAIPLLCFAAAAKRLPLTIVGLLQYLAPVLQFIVGVTILGETMSASRWVGFGLVWAALMILTADSLGLGRRRDDSTPAS